MTIEEFNEVEFSAGMKVLYKGKQYDIVTVDFEEKLIGIELFAGGDCADMVRCENCILV